MNQQTIDMLTDMKLSAMAAEFAAQLKDSSFNALSFEERFSMEENNRMGKTGISSRKSEIPKEDFMQRWAQ